MDGKGNAKISWRVGKHRKVKPGQRERAQGKATWFEEENTSLRQLSLQTTNYANYVTLVSFSTPYCAVDDKQLQQSPTKAKSKEKKFSNWLNRVISQTV